MLVTGPPVDDQEKQGLSLLSSELFSQGVGDIGEAEESFLKDFVQGNEDTQKMFLALRESSLSKVENQVVQKIDNPECNQRYYLSYF